MSTEYKLYYWPGLPGRGDFVRLVLEYAGIPYDDVARMPPSEAMAAVVGARKDMPGTAHYAPPILSISPTFSLSQTPVIAAYLAKKHGLMPDGEKEWIAMQIDHTVHDVVGECHNSHHPVDVTCLYEDQLSEAKRAAEVYVSQLSGVCTLITKKRLPAWLEHLEKCVKTHGSDEGPYLFGKDLCYVDLSIAQLLKGIEFSFPHNFIDKLSPNIPRLLALRDAVEKCDKIAAYRESDRCTAFKDGIFRCYPELDTV